MHCGALHARANGLASKVQLRIYGRMSENDPENTHLPATQRSLPIAMLRGREAVMAPYRRMLSKIGVTEQQWRVLRVLDERGTLDPREIAEAACLLNPSLTRIMQLLERKGYISRKAHPDDRRKTRVSITDEGRALIVSAEPESLRIAEELKARFGQEKIDALLDLLGELAEVHKE